MKGHLVFKTKRFDAITLQKQRPPRLDGDGKSVWTIDVLSVADPEKPVWGVLSGDGKTEIYISHRGMMEVYTTSQKDQTGWQPREADPELETEFLRRLMVKLGVSEAQAKAVSAAVPSQSAARVATVSERPVVQMDEDFDRAWRRVGLALDRTGFTVEDRDRAQGTYFVRYVPTAAADAKKPGFFGRLFGSKGPEVKPAKYQIKVTTTGTLSTVAVLDAQGQPGPVQDAQRIVKILVDDLK